MDRWRKKKANRGWQKKANRDLQAEAHGKLHSEADGASVFEQKKFLKPQPFFIKKQK